MIHLYMLTKNELFRKCVLKLMDLVYPAENLKVNR